MFKKFLIVFFIVYMAVWVNFCGKSELKEVDKITAVKLIHSVTSGLIFPDSKIRVKFKESLTDEQKKNIEKNNKDIIELEPSVNGETKVVSDNEIEFIPKNPLKKKTKYKVKLNLYEIFDNIKEDNVYTFEIDVAGKEVSSYKGNFELTDKKNPNEVFYKAKITFTSATNLNELKESLSFLMYDDNNSYKVDVNVKELSNREFLITTRAFKRDKKPLRFKLIVKKMPVDISDDFVKKIVLFPLKEFKVLGVRPSGDEKRVVIVDFSDKVNTSQNFSSLINIKGLSGKAKFKSVGNKVIIYGNFVSDNKYSIYVKGIRSVFNVVCKDFKGEVRFADIKPNIEFLSKGAFMPTSKDNKLGFKTINVKKVKIVVKKIFESNLGQFLQDNFLLYNKNELERIDYYEMNRVGITVLEKDLIIGNEKNKWIFSSIDLNKLLKNGDKGIYEIGLTFTKKDILYKKKLKTSYSYSNYYEDPYSYGYYYNHGKVYKTVVLSDIGLTLKVAGKDVYVFANNLIDSSPISGVKINLRTYQNQIIAEGETDSDGFLKISNIESYDIYYIEGIKGNQRSFIKLNKMEWETSSFDIGGKKVKDKGLKYFIYTERGVYRPGDEVNVNLILRDKTNTFPNNHPVVMKVYNPRNQVVFNLKNTKAKDGFYHFKFKTDVNDPTGTWSAVFFAGDYKFYHNIKIETVVPERLKIEIKPEKKVLDYSDDTINADINVKYLFGAPGSGLNAEAKIIFEHYNKSFKKFKGFSFTNGQVKFNKLEYKAFSGKLDSNGNAKIKFELPDFSNVSSSVSAVISVKAFEKSGKFTQRDSYIMINPYKYYLGIRLPNMDYGYAEVGKKMGIDVIMVDKDGKPVIGKTIKYKIYRNERVWWWEYDDSVSYKLKFKKDRRTEVIDEGEFISKPQPYVLNFKPNQTGKYLIEVFSDEENSQRSSTFFSVSFWGDTSNVKNAGVLVLKTDKKEYEIGDTAKLIFPCPEDSTILFTLEKKDKILMKKIIRNNKAEKERVVEIKLTKDMLPNVYASVSIIQPHSHTLNDRPIRLYGIIPIKVKDSNTRIKVDLITNKVFKPGKKFKVKIKTNIKRKVQYTIAVVDEGLLSLTDFKTPNPWNSFYSKQMLLVNTYDLYSYVIGANKNDFSKLFAIGGDAAIQLKARKKRFRKSLLDLNKAKRFKAVSMFKGPLFTNDNGEGEVEFKMPNYFGAVRVMVVVVDKSSYGSVEKTVPVKDDIVLITSLPRVIGVGDQFILSANTFITNDKIKKGVVKCNVSGPLEIVGKDKKSLMLSGDKKEIMSEFVVRAKNEIGVGKIEVNVKSGKFSAVYKTEISVRANSPRIFGIDNYELKPDSKRKIIIPNKGIKGTNTAKLIISTVKKLNITHRYSYLIKYPYGCIEQTVSSVFPQLFLKDYFAADYLDKKRMDDNINQGIERLNKFQIFDGSLSYWPGEKSSNEWGSIYGAHFLIEAKKRGYYIDGDLYNSLINYLFKKADNDNNEKYWIARAYRLYVLSMTKNKNISAMNLLKENGFKKMDNVSKWLLIGAYYNCGYKDLARNLALQTSTDVIDYKYSYYSYGSSLRDYAMILDVLNLTGFRKTEADRIYDLLIKSLSSDSWYSTQTLGYSLLSIGKYFEKNFKPKDNKNILKGFIKVKGSDKINIDSNSNIVSLKIKKGFGKTAEIFIDKTTSSKRIFVSLEWSAIPLLPEPPKASRIKVGVIYLDENGKAIDVSSLKRGKSFWVFGGVKLTDKYTDTLNDVAFVYMLPAGWEVENPRMKRINTVFYDMIKKKLSNYRYLDIRDDRLIYFFNIDNYDKTAYFLFKVNAVNPGSFILPPMTAEAMYDRRYYAIGKAKRIEVK